MTVLADFENTLGEKLNAWVDTDLAKKTSKMTLADKTRITTAQAEVYKKGLTDLTNQEHRTTHDDKVFGHAADDIHMAPLGMGGAKDVNELNGTLLVGWGKHYHAKNMQFINDGTKYVTGDHFVTNYYNDSAIHSAMKAAGEEAWREILNRKD